MSLRTIHSGTSNGAYFAHDPAPQLRPAGKTVTPDRGGVRADITQLALNSNRIQTPESLKPFRREHMATLGSSTRHPGFRSDSPRSTALIYGRKNLKDGSVDDCLNPNSNADKMNNLAAEHAEKRYLSNRKEPLGRVPDASIPIPERLIRDGFGIPTEKSESAKLLIYGCADKEAKQIHPPGEQKVRSYDWASANIDPTHHRFGAVTTSNGVTTKTLLQPQDGAKVLPKIVRDFNTINSPELSKTRNLGFGSREKDADYTYGKTVLRDALDAQQLITGVAIQEQGGYAEPDSEYNQLGGTFVKSSTQRKLRSLDKSDKEKFGGSDRPLGVPSVRTDIPKPDEGGRKITSGVNYGDDVNARHLLYPSHYVSNGTLSKYYSQPRTLDEIKQLATKLNFGLSDTQIETAFLRVAHDGKAAPEDFKNSVNELGY